MPIVRQKVRAVCSKRVSIAKSYSKDGVVAIPCWVYINRSFFNVLVDFDEVGIYNSLF